MLIGFKIKRPFSRQIRLRTESMIEPSGRAAFFKTFAGRVGRAALETGLGAVARGYAGEGPEAERLLDVIRSKGFASSLARLHQEADLRKFLLECLRDHSRAHGPLSHAQAEPLLAFSRLTDPESERIFRQAGPEGEPITLLKFDYAAKRPQGLRINIYMRASYYGPGSRPHDLRHRFKTALEGDGVTATLIDPDAPVVEFPPCDLALIDDTHVFRKNPVAKRQFLERVRAQTGTLAMLEPDPWSHGLKERIDANRDLYDYVWSMTPSLAVGGEGGSSLHGLPLILIPFPVGAPAIFDRHSKPGGVEGQAPITFHGGVEPYNFYRYYWVLAGSAMAHPPRFNVTSHDDDGLGVMDSLDRYVGLLAGSYACLNLLMRADGRTMLVGRSSDALRLGQLLVQERSADMRSYFTPGEEFLEFGNVEQLENICARLANGERYSAVRKAGVEVFAAKYADDPVLRHLVTKLR